MSLRMVLKSTDSTLFHPNNTTFSFRVHLPHPLNLDGAWTISLLEFSLDPGKTKQQVSLELFVCCNLCEDSIVGEREIPLLQRVYLEKQHIYQNPYEVPMKLGHFQDVHVYIRDAKPSPALFLSGEVTVTLLLRKLPFL